MRTINKNKKKIATLAYITLIGTIISICINIDSKDNFTGFHIRQALGLWLMFYVLIAMAVIFKSFMIHMGFWLFSITLIIYGLTLAAQGKEKTVPIVGIYFQNIFTFIK